MKPEIELLKRAVARVDARMANRPAVVRHHEEAVVRQAVAAALGGLVGVPAEHVTDNDALRGRWGMDDLARIELALALEEALQLVDPLPQSTWRLVSDVVRDVRRCPARMPEHEQE